MRLRVISASRGMAREPTAGDVHRVVSLRSVAIRLQSGCAAGARIMNQATAQGSLDGTAAAIDELAAAFGNRLVTSRAVREQHGHNTTWVANEPPDAVVFPQSTEDVQQVVR